MLKSQIEFFASCAIFLAFSFLYWLCIGIVDGFSRTLDYTQELYLRFFLLNSCVVGVLVFLSSYFFVRGFSESHKALVLNVVKHSMTSRFFYLQMFNALVLILSLASYEYYADSLIGFFIAIYIFIAFYCIFQIMQLHSKNLVYVPRPSPSSTDDLIETPNLAESEAILWRLLRKRARNSRQIAIVILCGIGMILVVASFVILFAGHITTIDLNTNDRLAEAERLRDRLHSEIGEHEQILIAIQTRIEVLNSDLERIATDVRDRLHESIGEDADSIHVYGADDPISNSERLRALANVFEQSEFIVHDIKAEIAELQSNWDNTARLRDDALETYEGLTAGYREHLLNSLLSSTNDVPLGRIFGQGDSEGQELSVSEADGLSVLVTTTITRFGILALMLFFLKILVNLYRYSMRLSVTYSSQADAILMQQMDADKLKKINEAISTSQIDFGSSPKTPLETLKDFAEIIKNMK